MIDLRSMIIRRSAQCMSESQWTYRQCYNSTGAPVLWPAGSTSQTPYRTR